MRAKNGRHRGLGASMVLPLFIVALLMEVPSWVWGNESIALAASGSILPPRSLRVLCVGQRSRFPAFLRLDRISSRGVFEVADGAARGPHCTHTCTRTRMRTRTRTATPTSPRRRNEQSELLEMSKAAKEGDVALQSVKVGPLVQEQVPLPDGISMEVLCQAPSRGLAKRRALPPLLFIHGSYHAAWCWAEHWMPFLANKGYETYSISLRGTSGTPIPGMEADEKQGSVKGAKVKVSEHVSDVRNFVETFLPGRSPIFVAHSFGGMVLLKLMEQLAGEAEAEAETAAKSGAGAGAGEGRDGATCFKGKMGGAVFLCSVPPSGNSAMTNRFIKERPLLAVKIVLGFVLKMAVFWPWLARDLFFSKTLEQDTLKRYMKNFRADSMNGLDLLNLRSTLPSRFADAEGRATWIKYAPPRLVLGAERDRIVDEIGIEEMATFLDTNSIMLPAVPHEVMLSPDWPLGVDRLLQWLETTEFQPPVSS